MIPSRNYFSASEVWFMSIVLGLAGSVAGVLILAGVYLVLS